MPARTIDTAYVEYVPDFSAIVRGQRELARQMQGLERAADDVTRDVEDSFRDMDRDVTRTFDEMSRDVDRQLDEIGRSADRTAEGIEDDFQTSGEVVERAFDEMQRSANRDLDQIERKAATTAATTAARFKGMGIAIGAAFAVATAAITAGLGALATMGLTSAAQLEQTQISFNALLGSAEKGEEVFKSLQQFAATTPFEFPEIADAGKRFLAFNESVGLTDDQLQEFLTVIGDLAAVTGTGAEGLNRITYALGQIGSKGKTSLEELLQISEAVPGFSAIGAIAQSMGVTSAEAMEMISKGAIDAQTGVAALLEGMKQFPGAAGAMELQSETLLGVFSTFKDTIGMALADAFTPVIPAIKDALTELTPVLGDALGVIAPALGGVIAAAMPLIGDIVQGLTPILTPILEGIGEAFAVIGPIFEPIGDAIGTLLEAFKPLIPVIGQIIGQVGAALAPVLTELAIALLPLAQPITDIVIALLPLIDPLAQILVIAAKIITPFAELTGLVVSLLAVEVLTPAIEGLVWVLELLLNPLEDVADAFNDLNWADIGRSIGDAFVSAWQAVADFFTGLWDWLGNLDDMFMDALRALPQVFVAGIKLAFRAAFTAIGIGIGAVLAFFIKLPERIAFAFTELPGILVEKFTAAGLAVQEWVTGWVTGLVNDVKEIPGQIVTALGDLGARLGRLFSDAFGNAKTTARNALDDIIAWVKRLPENIASFSSSVANSIVAFFKRALNSAISAINDGIRIIDDRIPGVSLPRIPLLAHGGIAFGPAIIGEDPGTSPEAAIPLGDARAMSALVDAFTQALRSNSGTATAAGIGNITVVALIDGREIDTRVVRIVDENNRQVKRTVQARR